MSSKEFSEAIAAQIRGIIAKKGLSKGEVSERSGIPPRTLARYLNSTPQLPIDTIRDLAAAIGVSVGDLVEAVENTLND